MLPDYEIITTKNEIKYILFNTNDVISDHIRKCGVFDEHILNIADFFIKNFYQNKDGKVLDIGSNIGTFSIPLALKYPNIDFYTYEVQPVVYYQLCANILLNKIDNIHANMQGLSDTEKDISIKLPDYNLEGNVGMYSLNNDYNGNLRGGNIHEFSGKVHNVSLKKLDNLEIDNIIFIKIDVEGMELDVLKGSISTLYKNNFPPILYEAWSHEWFAEKKRELENFLINMGYSIHYFGDNSYAQHKLNGLFLQFSK